LIRLPSSFGFFSISLPAYRADVGGDARSLLRRTDRVAQAADALADPATTRLAAEARQAIEQLVHQVRLSGAAAQAPSPTRGPAGSLTRRAAGGSDVRAERRMKTLYLLRHAKSSWADTGVGDLDRPLAPRGHRAAEKIATHLRRQRVAPAIVLCSSARRARETLAVVAPAFGSATEHAVEEGLYAASAAELLSRLRRIPDRTTSVMIIGHNPGLQDLAVTLAGHGARLERLREGFPTTALAVLRSPIASWRELGPGDAKLIDFVVPREL
jgi:phosphohistidine phosphatase